MEFWAMPASMLVAGVDSEIASGTREPRGVESRRVTALARSERPTPRRRPARVRAGVLVASGRVTRPQPFALSLVVVSDLPENG